MKIRVIAMIVAAVFFVASAGTAAEEAQKTTQTGGNGPRLLEPVKFDISPPLRDIKVPETGERQLKISREHEVPEGLNAVPENWKGKEAVRFSPHVLQKTAGSRAAIPAPTVNVEGLGRGFSGYTLSGAPPDTTGGVGPNYYIQWVNTDYVFFNKDGSVVDLAGNDWRAGNTIWSGFGGECETSNDGDPVVLYDQLAGRWVMTQFGLGPGSGPHYQCIAVSTTGDPLGTWARAAYQWPSNYLNDYPKLGVWTDGYYLAVNQFSCDNSYNCNWVGGAVAVFDRENLVQGTTPRATQYFNLGAGYGSLLPADIDGDTEPPAGRSGYFFADQSSYSDDKLDIWETSIDWGTPANSTVGDASHNPSTVVDVTNYVTTFTVEQQGTTNELDSLSPRLMFRAGYRNFGDHESVVLAHTVGNNPAGMRWYEIRDPGGTPVLYQEGTYAPDTQERWMGAVAMDASGNIALGYSVSGDSTSPSIRATGRLADDPLGTMTFSELEIVTGAGHQNPYYGQNRWGDYSTMSIDPSDDCTFWYTQEYVASVGSFVWRTRVAAFKFDECSTDAIFADDFEGGTTDAWSNVMP